MKVFSTGFWVYNEKTGKTDKWHEPKEIDFHKWPYIWSKDKKTMAHWRLWLSWYIEDFSIAITGYFKGKQVTWNGLNPWVLIRYAPFEPKWRKIWFEHFQNQSPYPKDFHKKGLIMNDQSTTEPVAPATPEVPNFLGRVKEAQPVQTAEDRGEDAKEVKLPM